MKDCISNIDLWFCNYENAKNDLLLEQYYNLMNFQERKKYDRFHFNVNRHQYLVTRALVRTVLSTYSPEISPKEWQFHTNKFGKPFIANSSLNNLLHFNISHTNKLIVLAVSKQPYIGVDVEYMKKNDKIIEIANRYFAPQELKLLLNKGIKEQACCFYDLWTLKESYIKAKGGGLSIPLNEFYFTFLNQIKINFSPTLDDDCGNWQFWKFDLGSSHKLAIATMNESQKNTYNIGFYKSIPLSHVESFSPDVY